MRAPDPVALERELVTCYLCRRRRKPDVMDGTRCADRDGCLRASGRRVSAVALTGAELAAAAASRRALRESRR